MPDSPTYTATYPRNTHRFNEKAEINNVLRGTETLVCGIELKKGDYKPPKGFKISHVFVQNMNTLLWIKKE